MKKVERPTGRPPKPDKPRIAYYAKIRRFNRAQGCIECGKGKNRLDLECLFCGYFVCGNHAFSGRVKYPSHECFDNKARDGRGGLKFVYMGLRPLVYRQKHGVGPSLHLKQKFGKED